MANAPVPSKPQPPQPQPEHSGNDQRSDVKNPNNPAFKSATDNRANQLNPNNAATKPDAPPTPGTGLSEADAEALVASAASGA